MGFWTKFGIAVGGIAAATLAIPTGGTSVAAFAAAATTVGASTAVAAAAGAAVAGVAAGGAVGHIIDKKKKKEAYQQGKEEATAAAAGRIKKMEEHIKSLYDSMQQVNEHYQLTIALVAVGMAAAKSVGKNSAEDKANIEEFVAGISGAALPDKVRQTIEKYKTNPPSMHDAITEVRKVKSVTYDHFKEVILLALGDENGSTEAGKEFLDEWNKAIA